jgi:hypothetical protein
MILGVGRVNELLYFEIKLVGAFVPNEDLEILISFLIFSGTEFLKHKLDLTLKSVMLAN